MTLTIHKPDCSSCVSGGSACAAHTPPVCVCDVPNTWPECDRCRHRGEPAMCHSCHRSYDLVFSMVRAAWREHLGMEP